LIVPEIAAGTYIGGQFIKQRDLAGENDMVFGSSNGFGATRG
jgi:hypothetical protein